MDLAVLVIAFDKKVFPSELEKNIKSFNADTEIIYILNEKNQIKTSEKCYYFSENNEDKAINSIIKNINGKSLLIIRNNYNLKNINKIEELILNKDKGDIILYNKKLGKFKSFCKKYYNIINDKILGYKLFDGDLSIMLLNDMAVSVLKELKNPSVFLKINKWTNINIVYLENKELNYYQPKLSFKKEIIFASVASSLMILSIILWACIKSFHTFFMGLLFMSIILLSFGSIIVLAWNFATLISVGRLENNTINYQEKENKDE